MGDGNASGTGVRTRKKKGRGGGLGTNRMLGWVMERMARAVKIFSATGNPW